MRPFSLYLHIPFCFHKCPYCDFNTYAMSTIPEKEYISALLCELDFRANLPEWKGRTIQTIYFGGGTPSLLSVGSIRKIINTICKTFAVSDEVEISMEANPGTVSSESLAGYHEAGVNRLSLGVQSFNVDSLKILGRMHSPEQSEVAIEQAKSAGFSNLNIDLIYGIPEQDLDHLERDLAHAIRLEPQHISAYGLTIEKGTPFYTSFRKGRIKLPNEEVSIEMVNLVNNYLEINSFKRYEISNFALRGKEARHNLAYWLANDYLGLGAGAHSYVADYDQFGQQKGARRWSSYALPQKYIKEAIQSGQTESWSDNLDRDACIFEFFFLGLRKIKGVDLSEFQARFGLKAEQVYPTLLHILVEQDLVKIEDQSLFLSSRGLLLADTVIENFSRLGEEQINSAVNDEIKEILEQSKLKDEQENIADTPLVANV